jgi:xyloglucan-specific exo-beta-1,4-glucanase
MKKITLLALLLAFGYSGQSQVSFEASPNFGKLEDITYDPTASGTLYAATQGNHLVVSKDNGATWTLLYSYPQSDFLDNLRLYGTSQLTFSTRDQIHVFDLESSTLVASFPVPPSGVDGAGASYLSSYWISASDANVMLVDTGFPLGFSSQGKTFYTTDGGENWTEIYYTVDHDNVFINNVAISPTSNQTFYLMRGNGDTDVDGGLWKSTDSGANFTETLTGVTLDPIAFNPTDANDILVGSSIGFGIHPENVFRSANGGDTWTEAAITWTDETLNNITKIVFNPTDPSKIIILEENEIVRTTDGGANWTSTVYPVGISMDYYYGLNASYNPSNANEIAISTDLFPQFSTDGGATLAQIKAPFYNIISTSTARESGNTHLYYGSNGGRLHKDITSGVTSEYDIEGPDSFNPKRNYIVADKAVPGRVFTYASMGFFGGWLNVSTDYGATTSNILQAFADDMQELTVDPNNNNIVFVSMRSGEGGQVYKLDITDLNNIIQTDIVTPEINEFGEGVVTGITISSADSNVIFIAKGTKVFKSIDGGQNWVEKSLGLENIVAGQDLIWDMQKNPLNENQLTVSSNQGIFTTTDAAENWNVVLPGVDVKRVKHSPLNDGVIVGTVFSAQFSDAQIVYTVDNGVTWETVSNEMINHVQCYSADYDFIGNTIDAYLATTDLGVMKYQIIDLPLATTRPLANAIGIAPNPATNVVRVSANTAIQDVSVFSMTGQKVLESQTAEVNVSALNNGIYLVKATLANGETATQKLVKK